VMLMGLFAGFIFRLVVGRDVNVAVVCVLFILRICQSNLSGSDAETSFFQFCLT
jgi:hypothetical protein